MGDLAQSSAILRCRCNCYSMSDVLLRFEIRSLQRRLGSNAEYRGQISRSL